MSTIPYLDDVLDPDVPVLSLSGAAKRLSVPQSRVEQMIRDRDLLAFKRRRVPVVPEVFLESEGRVLKGLPGLITLMLDGGYTEEEVLRWLFTADETLPGTPVDALQGNRAKEVTRRAQSMAL